MMIARSSAHATKLIVKLDVQNVYLLVRLFSHLRSGSRNIRKRYGLSVSPCIVPLYIGMSFVLPKYSPVNMILEFEYMFSFKDTASSGYPKSLVMANNLAWSREPKAFLKFIYNILVCKSCVF